MSDARERIDSAGLVDILQGFVYGQRGMSSQQIRAVEILLKKTLPDLASQQVELSGNTGVMVQVVRLSDLPADQQSIPAPAPALSIVRE